MQKTEPKAIRIKILKSFHSPLSNKALKVGQELNISPNRFWFKRLNDKDCEQISLKSRKIAKKENEVLENKPGKATGANKKGSN